jgi:tetratricopeptide (TPR) repeat protein
MGRLREARDTLERIFHIQPATEQPQRGAIYLLDPCVTSMSMLARTLAFMGHLDGALEKATVSLEFANRLAHPQSVAYATFWAGWIHHARGEHDKAGDYLRPAMALSSEYGLTVILEWGRVVWGSALAHLGRTAEGIAEMRRSLSSQQTMRSLLERAYCLTLLAEALGRQGQNEEAIALCDEALAFGRRTGGRCYEAETHRVKGEIALASGEAAEKAAAAEFEHALEIARQNQGRLLELRAAVSYFELQRRVGHTVRGAGVLAQAVASFNEGGDCPILKRARQLLGSV